MNNAIFSKEKLAERLEGIEWEDFEVKEARNEIPKSSWETVSAFSNTAGGWLIFGARKSGKSFEISGVDNPGKIEQDFTTTLRGQKFNRKISVISKKYSFGSKHVLAFYVPLSNVKPVYFDNPKNTFIRSGSGDQRLTEFEVASLFRDSAFGKKDREPTILKLGDLSKESISRYRTYLKNIKPEHPYNRLGDSEFFTKLGVLEKGLPFGFQDRLP